MTFTHDLRAAISVCLRARCPLYRCDQLHSGTELEHLLAELVRAELHADSERLQERDQLIAQRNERRALSELDVERCERRIDPERRSIVELDTECRAAGVVD